MINSLLLFLLLFVGGLFAGLFADVIVSEIIWKERGQYPLGFPGSSEGKVSACNVRDPGSIPWLERTPEEGNDNPLQHYCPENPMDREARWAGARQPPLSILPREEYWSGLPFPTPGDLPNPGFELVSPASPELASGFFTTEPPGKPNISLTLSKSCSST